MKKLVCIMICFLVFGCSSEEVDPNVENYNEVLAIEETMEKLTYFKMNKHEDTSYLSCDGEIVNPNEGVGDFQYRFQFGDDMNYIATTKVSDEIQYVTHYFTNNTLFISFSQMPSDISTREASEKESTYAFFDMAIKAIDLQFYEVDKESNDSGTLYTITLEDPKGYDEMYPDDYDNRTCGLVGSYDDQVITIQTNTEGQLIYVEVKQTLTYTMEGVDAYTHTDVIRYDYYDLGVEDPLDFSIIS